MYQGNQLGQQLIAGGDTEAYGSKVGQEQGVFYNIPEPSFGKEFVPAPGTQPEHLILNAISAAILKKLQQYKANYDGETNSDGNYHGRGLCRFADGSYYDGEWNNGLRHGLGTYRFPDGTTYTGGWDTDRMHGHGEMKYATGQILRTTWDNGFRHGEGSISEPSGQQVAVTYYKDLEIREDRQNPDNYDNFHRGLIIFICFFVVLLLPLAFDLLVNDIYLGQSFAFLFGFILYVVMIADACKSKSLKSMKNPIPSNTNVRFKRTGLTSNHLQHQSTVAYRSNRRSQNLRRLA